MDALRATLAAVHSHAPEANYETLGATTELTIVKHQLRDWIESRLGSVKDLEHLEAASTRINEDLKAVSVTASKDDQNLMGSVGRLGSSSAMLHRDHNAASDDASRGAAASTASRN